MRSWLTYTAARLVLFAAAFGVVYLFGARSWIALILAWVISGLASYVLLSKWRDRMSKSVVDWSQKREDKSVANRLTGGAAREDEIQDEILRAQEEAAASETGQGTEKDAEADADKGVEKDAEATVEDGAEPAADSEKATPVAEEPRK